MGIFDRKLRRYNRVRTRKNLKLKMHTLNKEPRKNTIRQRLKLKCNHFGDCRLHYFDICIACCSWNRRIDRRMAYHTLNPSIYINTNQIMLSYYIQHIIFDHNVQKFTKFLHYFYYADDTVVMTSHKDHFICKIT